MKIYCVQERKMSMFEDNKFNSTENRTEVKPSSNQQVKRKTIPKFTMYKYEQKFKYNSDHVPSQEPSISDIIVFKNFRSHYRLEFSQFILRACTFHLIEMLGSLSSR